MLPHAPQFFTTPETEDRETVGRVRVTAAEIGARLKAMAPDLWIIISNDHAEQFFHLAAPPSRYMPAAKHEVLLPGAIFIAKCPVRSVLNSSDKCTGKALIQPSPAPPRSTTR